MRRVGEKFAIRSSLIVGIVGWRLVREIVKLKEWDEWRNVAWAGNGLLLLGWVIGYFLPDIDDLFYVYISDPGDKIGNQAKTLLAGGDVRRAWDLLVATRGERKNLPVHNILTGLAVAVAGVWVVSSSGSPLAMGAVLGVTTRMFIGAVIEKNYMRWYWIFAREFSRREHQVVMAVWGVLLGVQIIGLVR
ncbi:hypothetical protein A3D85_00735 [Candidatus Amesbacteria bacterium RIFCSPHIGHO2_02_FULL_47_9]|uniref:Uncharacterized protein n=1 Tax=Candidatus Amesbacteria bacterium RIFCSPHIGHO2_01_FULL_48_32b TaxID=1797253 RepID=A0A1F4YEQ0_9BACT|nr:MAG: hypothetical protein A2876_04105 [Candidatus Amesbacteria bacterium RIFCSPHIGHO2_01_FULL_48_32b]OGD02717.1 MAG: hypothetical protein A3D85_00735 [Candidatus Amesbacteria bacterium RIFCSPHIGHO2_02_FULL_47_9]OGD08582.1 MAG: hypothetical protein A2899_02375 [Candidatus Amesbacteria bacterium RIFCSPLOWO2_01_FULL_49_25]